MTTNGKRQVSFEFHLHATQANEVLLLGDFTEWESHPIRLRRLKNGTWSTKVTLESGHQYQYRYQVDGHWEDDGQCPSRVGNPFGSENCLLVVK